MSELKIKVKPEKHQLEAAKFLLSQSNGVVNSSTGSGKTIVAIITGFYLLSEDKVDKVVFVGTKSSVKEIEKDIRTNTRYTPLLLQRDMGIDRFYDKDKFVIVQNNYFDVFEEEKLIKYLKSKRVCFIIDEVHKLKNPASGLTMVYAKLRDSIDYFYGITATLFQRDVYDIFNVVSLIRPGFLGTKNDFDSIFLERKLKTIYMQGKKRKCWEVVGYKNEVFLKECLNRVVFNFFPNQDVKVLRHDVDLVNVERYKVAAKGLLDVETSKMYSVRLIDLQYTVNEDEAKINKMLELVNKNLHKGAIVFCAYYNSINSLKELFKANSINNRQIDGTMSSEDRNKAKEWFVSDPKGKVIIITMAGGESINLQATNAIIMYDLPFGYGALKQIMGRVVRFFSAFKQFEIYVPVVKGTIDEYKYDLFLMNRDINSFLFGDELPMKEESVSKYLQKRLKNELLWCR